MLKLIQLYYQIVSIISPKWAAKSAFSIFQKVRKKDIRTREQPFYKEANKYVTPFDNEDIDCYEFGVENEDVVLLVHGWDSNVGCMYAMIDGLLAKNKRVIGFNLPAHAFHESSRTNLHVAKEAFKAVFNQLPNQNNVAVISHSFGSAMTAYALSEMNVQVDQLIFLSTPNHIIHIFEEFKELIKLGDKAYELLIEKADQVLGESLKKLRIEEKITKAKFNHLHLIHDKIDKVIPFKNSEDIHNVVDNSTLHPFNRVGHYRMLWVDEVIDLAVKLV